MNAKLTPTTCAHCGGEYQLIDLLDGWCLQCMLGHKDETERILTKTFTLRKWHDDSIFIKRINRKEYYAKRGGKR